MKRVRISFYVDEELKAKMDEMKRRGIKKSSIVQKAIEAWLRGEL